MGGDMGQPILRWLARSAAVVVALPLGAGVMDVMAPASSASPVSHFSGASRAAGSGLAAAPASLRAAIRTSLGAPVSPAGYTQTGELTASDAAQYNGFGYSVALSALGTTALIGAGNSSDTAPYTGAAYVFTLRGSTWSQTGELTASDIAPDDIFGYSVALSALGTTALIGSPGFPFRTPYAGAAYVFTDPA